MGNARLFEAQTERQGSGFRTVARVQCRKCGVSHTIPIRAQGGLLPPAVVAKKFAEKGWEIGSNPQWDLCAGCKLKKEKAPVLKVDPDSILKAETERSMAREDRRLIFEKMHAVYLDEARGYQSGWSDQRVATDMGVPRKWVEQVRSEMFGENGANAEMNEFLAEAESLLTDARKSLTEAREHREKAEALFKEQNIQSALNHISDRLGKIEKLAAEVRKLVLAP